MLPAAYHLWTIGCQMNEADALRAAALLESAGLRPVAHADDASFLLLNTCVVRQQAEDKALGRLRHVAELKRRNPELVVVLMGCLVGRISREQDALRERFPFVDLFLPPSDLRPLQQFLRGRGVPVPGDMTHDDFLPPPLPDSQTGRSIVAHVPVVLGCSHACSYCVIPYRRGGERSRPSADILAEVQTLASRGVREIILLGQIVDRYGLDRPGEIRLPELLRRTARVPGIARVRFLTSHPRWITPELIAAVAGTPGLCPYFEVPVQAGSDAVLAAMRRGYTVAEYEALVGRIRAAIPGTGLSTDIIVGFPGETAAQFEDTAALMDRLDPDMIRIAKYSPRPLTWSARHLPDDVPEAEKERRRLALEAALRERLTRKHAPLAGHLVEILVETLEKNGRRYGRTPDYKPVFVEGSDAAPGDLLQVRLTWAGPFSFIAEPAGRFRRPPH
ncbi:MAG TPA: MiaB/RimO family radical SAM methylthiotransferase [Kiritimatiellia bacterium]|nr:MiaB/RimO family radical SAM methylthiotransferase [Kiritimatiellia bacterium]HPR68509.1 MiaB/RimO family radical SAM methylthiotransferase [Kiritimatiellia bacterium]